MFLVVFGRTDEVRPRVLWRGRRGERRDRSDMVIPCRRGKGGSYKGRLSTQAEKTLETVEKGGRVHQAMGPFEALPCLSMRLAVNSEHNDGRRGAHESAVRLVRSHGRFLGLLSIGHLSFFVDRVEPEAGAGRKRASLGLEATDAWPIGICSEPLAAPLIDGDSTSRVRVDTSSASPSAVWPDELLVVVCRT
jgi:hypothetical protein